MSPLTRSSSTCAIEGCPGASSPTVAAGASTTRTLSRGRTATTRSTSRDLVGAGEAEPFLYFYAFFDRAAFEQLEGETLILYGMLCESVDYARGISESLKAKSLMGLATSSRAALAISATTYSSRLRPCARSMRTA